LPYSYYLKGASGGSIDINPEPFQASRMAQLLCKAPYIFLLLSSCLQRYLKKPLQTRKIVPQGLRDLEIVFGEEII